MIYIFTALYSEAQIFIEQYHLKRVMESTRFQQFCQESADIRLTVSGAGEIAAAAAVSSVCTEFKPGEEDFLLNAGICAGSSGLEGIFLVHKLTEQATGKTFYPDMLYRHNFQEAGLVTRMCPWRRMQDKEVCAAESQDGKTSVRDAHGTDLYDRDFSETDWHDRNLYDVNLYDMEAAAVYQAGSYFFAPHQMMFLKIVSDHGEGRRLSADNARRCMQVHKDSIAAFLEQLLKAGRSSQAEKNDRLQKEKTAEKRCRSLCEDMHCSQTMGHVLRQHIRYAVLAGMDYEHVIEELYREGRLPCKDKREGKQCFEELKKRLL